MNKLTIQQQLARRHDCRYGLRGLQCHLAGDEAPYRILGKRLGQRLPAAANRSRRAVGRLQAASDAELLRVGGRVEGRFSVIDAAALSNWQEPQGFGVIETTADKVCLSEPWPHMSVAERSEP